ncbi:MAG: transposase [Clostridiales bacterium]|nr:transposase [Clostridiales bacterium]
MILNRRASLRKTLSTLDLSEAEKVLKSKYKYTPGKQGRPPLPPIGMFLSFTIMFLRMESYRDYHAFLERDMFWKRTLGFDRVPDIGSFSNFLKRIGPSSFEHLFQVVVQQLLDEGFLNLYVIAQDGSILEANLDDPEAGWGWDHIKKEFVYGYKIHVTVDTHTELPVTLSITKAGVHDSKEFQRLYTNVKSYNARCPTHCFTADKAYDSSDIRKTLLRDNVIPVIKASKTRIKPHYPDLFLKRYAKRVSVERFFSRLKNYLDLKKHQVAGKNNVLIYSYIIIIGMLLISYVNYRFGFSPRSVKTFLRTFT